MAFKRLTIEGNGQIELNRVTFSRTGEVEAQCEWAESDRCENGMLLAVDKAASKVKYAENADSLCPIGLNYSAEHMYEYPMERSEGTPWDPQTNSRYADYFLGVQGGNFYPRLGFLSVGDVFMTNCVGYDDGEFADDAAVIAAVKACADTALYGMVGTKGAIKVSATAPASGLALKVVNNEKQLGGYTMADGQDGIKFQVCRV